MKHRLTTLMLTLFGLVTTVFGQQAKIEGYVYNHNDRRVASVRIVVTPGGQAGITDNKGHFIINLPDSIQPGQAAQIRVDRPAWVIFNPMFGKCETKSVARNFEPLRVVIVPKGSPLSYGPKRLSKFVDELQRQVARVTDEANKAEREREKYNFLLKYAEEYGVPLERLRAALDEWAHTKETDDKLERARKEYWRKNLAKVTELTGQAGPIAVRVLKEKNKQRLESGRTVISIYTLEGNAFYEQYKFSEALKSLDTLEKLFLSGDIRKEELASEWADVKVLIGKTKVAFGVRVAGADGPRHLNEALEEYQAALTVFTREQSPRDWAVTQNNMGVALLRLGERARGARGADYLRKAEAAYRAALEVVTLERWPREWALMQINIGLALHNLGKRVEGAESIRHLKASEAVYRAVLLIKNVEALPQVWGITQDNLGITLRELGVRAGATESIPYLREAEAAHRNALKVHTREQLPQEWSLAQHNLGNALTELGRRSPGDSGVAHLKEAVAAFQAALDVRTREHLPQLWATSHADMGNALSNLGERTGGAESLGHLKEAAKVYRAALEIFTRELWPYDWASGLNNLGGVLTALGERTEGAAGDQYLKEAEAAFLAALEVFPREQSPQQWGMTQNNLGLAQSHMGRRLGDARALDHLNKAVAYFRAALSVFTREKLPQQWAMTQNNLGNTLRLSGELMKGTPEGARYLKEAEAAYLAALEVRTRARLPQQWAMTQVNLGSVYYLLGEWARASEVFINALEFYPDNAAIYDTAVEISHERLFRYEQAFELHQRWAARHEGDIAALADFAESHFTTARFSESQQRIAALLALPEVPELSASSRVALRAIEIASLLALGQEGRVPGRFDELIAEVSRQPAAFKVEWSFNGTKNFIAHNEKLAPHRIWLGQLMDAVASGDRDGMLTALREVRAKLKD